MSSATSTCFYKIILHRIWSKVDLECSPVKPPCCCHSGTKHCLVIKDKHYSICIICKNINMLQWKENKLFLHGLIVFGFVISLLKQSYIVHCLFYSQRFEALVIFYFVRIFCSHLPALILSFFIPNSCISWASPMKHFFNFVLFFQVLFFKAFCFLPLGKSE